MEELKKRKPTRLADFDYSSAGAYFITICTQNRKNVLSRIVWEGSALPQLSRYGETVDKWIGKIPQNFNDVFVDNYVIMPNHIHLLLSIVNDGRADPSHTVDSIVGWLKYNITKEICQIKETEKVFQRSFHDHIVRNRHDYDEIYKYISENPMRWHSDKFYC